MNCPTVKIKSTNFESQGAFVIINEEDYDPAKHTLYVEGNQVGKAVNESPKEVVIEQPSFASNVEPEAPKRGRPSKFEI